MMENKKILLHLRSSTTMENKKKNNYWSMMMMMLLLLSITLNILLLKTHSYDNQSSTEMKEDLSWAKTAAAEAEAVAALTCSGHGRALLDSLVENGSPSCECNSCFSGPDCSIFLDDCVSNVDSGDPLFLEPFWMGHAESSAILTSGWHRMSYVYPDHMFTSPELQRKILAIHAIIGNAYTDNRFFIFGAGSIQLLNAAVYALSPDQNSSDPPARVVVSVPFYPVYQNQTELFDSNEFQFQGDTSLWSNETRWNNSSAKFIEFVTSPNNPDGMLKNPVLQGPNAYTIYDHAYYWPHFTSMQGPVDGDVNIFTISKLTGHASSRLGWAFVKDKATYERMSAYMMFSTMGASRDTQLRALKLLKVVLKDNGRQLFEFGFNTMKIRWEKLSNAFSKSKRFSLQEIPDQLFCNYFNKTRGPSPAYAWVKCEWEEDSDCIEVFKEAKILGRRGSLFGSGDGYVRLSLIKTQDDFDLLLKRINQLVANEKGAEGSVHAI
ncbi:unnamed protein product [Rhodiola kirilowii]